MEKELIKKIVKDATLKHLPHSHPYKVADLENTLIENLSKSLTETDMRKIYFRECWEIWMNSKDDRDFIKWILKEINN